MRSFTGGRIRNTAVPIFPPTSTSRADALKDVPDQRRGSGFAIGSGNGHDARARTRNFPLEHFRIANDFNAGGFGLHHGPMRFRMGKRNTGLKTRLSSVAKSIPCRSETGKFAAFAAVTAASESSHAKTWAPPSRKASAQARPERARPKSATFLSLNVWRETQMPT